MLDDAGKDALLLDLLGGADLLRAAESHFGDGESLAVLSEWLGTPTSTLHRKLNKLRATLARHGQLPAHWRQHRPGRPAKPTIVSTEKELHQPWKRHSTKWDESA